MHSKHTYVGKPTLFVRTRLSISYYYDYNIISRRFVKKKKKYHNLHNAYIMSSLEPFKKKKKHLVINLCTRGSHVA